MRYASGDTLARLSLLFSLANGALSQALGAPQQMPVKLQVEAGTPLRVYIVRRVPYRVGQVVQAKLIEPIWAFDRVVIPEGSTLQGQVVELDPVPKMMRARAILGGDFTPLKRAQVSFMSLKMPDGRAVPLQTEESLGLPILYDPPRPPKNRRNRNRFRPTRAA